MTLCCHLQASSKDAACIALAQQPSSYRHPFVRSQRDANLIGRSDQKPHWNVAVVKSARIRPLSHLRAGIPSASTAPAKRVSPPRGEPAASNQQQNDTSRHFGDGRPVIPLAPHPPNRGDRSLSGGVANISSGAWRIRPTTRKNTANRLRRQRRRIAES